MVCMFMFRRAAHQPSPAQAAAGAVAPARPFGSDSGQLFCHPQPRPSFDCGIWDASHCCHLQQLSLTFCCIVGPPSTRSGDRCRAGGSRAGERPAAARGPAALGGGASCATEPIQPMPGIRKQPVGIARHVSTAASGRQVSAVLFNAVPAAGLLVLTWLAYGWWQVRCLSALLVSSPPHLCLLSPLLLVAAFCILLPPLRDTSDCCIRLLALGVCVFDPAQSRGKTMYMGLIVVWSAPILAIQVPSLYTLFPLRRLSSKMCSRLFSSPLSSHHSALLFSALLPLGAVQHLGSP